MLMLFALDLFDYKTQYYQILSNFLCPVQACPQEHLQRCRPAVSWGAWVLDLREAGRGLRAWCVDFKSTAATANHGRKIRSMKYGNRVAGNLTLSLVNEGLANDRVVGDIWVPWSRLNPPNLSLPSISSTCACCTLTTPWISWLHSLRRCILFLADPWHERCYTTTLAGQTCSQVLDTTACLRQSECCLMHLAERHMHQLGSWVKSYSWDDEMTCQIGAYCLECTFTTILGLHACDTWCWNPFA